ncbi:hypothetical protein ACSSS7_006738 [Eimeria intestinalis]
MASSTLVEEHNPALPPEGISVGRESLVRAWNTRNAGGDFSVRGQLHRIVGNARSTAGSTGIVLASLIFAYLLLVCYRHFSGAPLVGAPQRMLASNFSNEDAKDCADPPGGDDGDEPPDNQPVLQSGGWTLPPMPLEVRRLMAGALRMLAQVTTECRRLASYLDRRQRRSLVYRLTKLAALELSGFAFLPPPLQPMRRWVTRKYLMLSSSLLNMYTTGRSSGRISRLLDFIKLLGEPPPENLTSTNGYYEVAMIRQLRLFQHANLNILNILEDLRVSVDPETNFVPSWRCERALETLENLYQVRLRQIVSHVFTRFWILRAQTRAAETFFFKKDFLLGRADTSVPLPLELQNITSAVTSLGGPAVSSYLDLDATTDADGHRSLPEGGTPGAGSHGPPIAAAAAPGVEGSHGESAPLHAVHGALVAGRPLLAGAYQAGESEPSQSSPGPVHSFAVGSMPAFAGLEGLVTGEGHGQQVPRLGIGVDEGTLEAFSGLQGASASSATALTSEEGATGGHTGERDDDDDDLLQLIHESLDWSVAFNEEGEV